MSMSTGFVGTPIYAPPEQLRADEQEFDVTEGDALAQRPLVGHRVHLQLLQPQVRKATWLDLVRGEISQTEFDIAQQGRREALASYAEAMDLDASPRLAAERAALQFVLRLPEMAKAGLDVEKAQET